MPIPLSHVQKEQLQFGRTLVEDKTFVLKNNTKYINYYFKNCTIQGQVGSVVLLNVIFENCTFELAMQSCKLINVFTTGTFHENGLVFINCTMQKTEFVEKYRQNCFYPQADLNLAGDIPASMYLE